MNRPRKVAVNQSPSQQAAAAKRKIRTLTRDLEDLVKETEAKRSRLLEAKKNRRQLLAQVKFLRRKYKSLMNNPPQTSSDPQQSGPSTQTPLQYPKPPLPTASRRRSIGVKSDSSARRGKGHCKGEGALPPLPLPPPTTLPPLPRPPPPTGPAGFDLNETAFTASKTNPADYPNPNSANNFPTKERSHRAKAIAAAPILDLNQAAVPTPEEADHRPGWDALGWENYSMEADLPMADLTPAVCRNLGKPSSRSGKRKISWQDQVPLWV